MNKTKLSATLLAILLSAAPSFAQVEVAETQKELGSEGFFVDAMSFAGNKLSASRLDVFLQVAYNDLTFLKKDDRYEASYEVTIAIYDNATKLVREKNWQELIQANTFDQSVSVSAFSMAQKSFELPQGKYFITILLQDNETRLVRRVVRQIIIPDYAESSLSLSDIMLISRITQAGEKRSMTPLVSGNVGSLVEGGHVFFESYSDSLIPSVQLDFIVRDEEQREKSRIDTSVSLQKGKTQFLLPVDFSSLGVGDYKLFILLKQGSGEADSVMASTNRKFLVRWPGLPRTVNDVATAIDQLVYIADKDEIEYIQKGTDVEEKQGRLMEFWKRKDPNPNTPRNEKMEEYYGRIEYANKHFSHYIEGWRTDMGMVFIIFGSPNSVDRHPFDMGSKPYEIWTYYDLNHSFTFLDESGFGDYHLTTPIWEVWQRPRN